MLKIKEFNKKFLLVRAYSSLNNENDVGSDDSDGENDDIE